jgi:hypothetical protein
MKGMKTIILLLTLFISTTVFSQSFRCVVVEWDDTVTVRNVDNLDIYRVVNSNYTVNYLPVPGLDTTLEVFVYREFSGMPPVDYRLYNVLVEEACLDSIDSEWPTNRIYAKQYSIVARDSSELFESVHQEENNANYGVFPYEKQLKYMAMYMMIHRRETQGFTITPKQQVILDRVEAKGELIWQNYINGLDKKEAIRNEETFDIDLGWNNTDPE